MTTSASSGLLSLPVPTPTELAAVRARLQRRSWPSRHVPRSGSLFLLPAGLVLVGLVLAVAGTVQASTTAIGIALSLMHAGVAGTWWLDDAAARAADRAVTQRLHLDGVGPSGRRRRLGATATGATWLLAMSQLGTTTLVAVRVSPAPMAAVAVLGPLLLLASHLYLARRDRTAPGVTGTPVLDVVDAAVARTSVADRVRYWAPFGITVVPLLSSPPDDPVARAAAWVVVVSGFAALGCAELLRYRARPCLNDPRLQEVTPSTSWLAGVPATVQPSRRPSH